MYNGFRNFLGKILSQDSEHRKALRGFVIVGIFALLAKTVGLWKEISVAERYGTSPDLDAYLFVFNLITLPVSVWYGCISSAFIPHLVRHGIRCRYKQKAYARPLLSLGLITGIISTSIVAAFIYAYTKNHYIPMPIYTKHVVVQILWPLSLIAPILFITHIGSIFLMARHSHVNTLLEGLPALSTVLILLAFSHDRIDVLIYGTISGVIVQMAITAKLSHMPVWPSSNIGLLKNLTPIWASALVSLGMNQFLQSSLGAIDQLFAANLDAGSISYLNYALRIYGVVLTFFALAIPRVILPIFSGLKMDRDNFRRIVLQWTFAIFVTGCVISCLIAFFSAPIVSLIFERGKFTAVDTEHTAYILAILVAQLPFQLAFLIISQALSARQNFRGQVISSGATLMFKAVLAYVLTTFMGLSGLVISAVIVAVFQLLVIYVVGFRKGSFNVS